MRVLGIETSCDETGVAIHDSGQGLLGHALYSQISTHAGFGGVVPELASRDHVRKLLPLIREVLAQANSRAEDIDAIAFTEGPGLVGALLVGAAVGRSLALAWNVPSLGIHHMEGHLLAPMLEDPAPEFPFVALLVSGGHTMLVDVQGVGAYRVLGNTLDDAAGEAFDKTAKLLGLPYPGGPELARLAEQGRPVDYRLPRPMTDRPGLDFSFSGLKTAVLTRLRQLPANDSQARADLARAFEEAVVETLCLKCQRALETVAAEGHPPRLVVSGGVGANQRLRTRLRELDAEVFYPRLEFCTDNGAMIAYAGCLRMAGGVTESLEISARPRWSLEGLEPVNGER